MASTTGETAHQAEDPSADACHSTAARSLRACHRTPGNDTNDCSTNHDYLHHTQTAHRASGSFFIRIGGGLLDAFCGVIDFGGYIPFRIFYGVGHHSGVEVDSDFFWRVLIPSLHVLNCCMPYAVTHLVREDVIPKRRCMPKFVLKSFHLQYLGIRSRLVTFKRLLVSLPLCKPPI